MAEYVPRKCGGVCGQTADHEFDEYEQRKSSAAEDLRTFLITEVWGPFVEPLSAKNVPQKQTNVIVQWTIRASAAPVLALPAVSAVSPSHLRMDKHFSHQGEVWAGGGA